MDDVYLLRYFGSIGLISVGLCMVYLWWRIIRSKSKFNRVNSENHLNAIIHIVVVSAVTTMFGVAPLLIGCIGLFQAWHFHPLF